LGRALTARCRETVATLLLAVAVGGCGGERLADSLEGWNVLLVTLDTTRADRLGCYGYEGAQTPVLDALANEGVVFDSAASHCPVTLPSHASMMTGLYPPRHGVRGNGVYRLAGTHDTLAEILREAGYRTAAAVAAFVLERRFGLDQGFERYDDFSQDMIRANEFTFASRSGEAVTESALRLASGFDGSRPYFLWVHYFDPHAPYEAPPPFASRFPSTESGRYDAEIASMDHSIGALLDGLESRGLLERTLVLVVGDHGEGFPGPHRERTHGMFVYEDTMRVPFVVTARGGLEGGRRVATLVRQVDIPPTVLELVGVRAGIDFEGRSLAGVLRGDDPSSIDDVPSYGETMAPWDNYGWAPLFQVRRGAWKFIDAPRPELYRLDEDPQERRNLIESRPDKADELRSLVRQFRTLGADGRGASHAAGAHDRKRLEALGYFTLGVEPPDERDFPGLADPKDRIHLQEALEDGRRLQIAGKPVEAARKMEEILAEDPNNREARSQLAVFLEDAGDLEGARGALLPLLELRPDSRYLLGRLARIEELASRDLEARGRGAEARLRLEWAIDHYRKAVEGEELDIGPMVNLGAIYLRRGNLTEAERLFERACAIDRNAFEPRANLAVALSKQGRFREALPPARRAVELAGEDRDRRKIVRIVEADILSRIGEADEAARILEEVIREHPDDPTTPALRQRLEELSRSTR
jgi:arylsulfatase A-like enzyme/Flp pilus assembly protein TadD